MKSFHPLLHKELHSLLSEWYSFINIYQTVGHWTLIRVMIYDFAAILLRSALRFPQWVLFSCPTQQVSNAGNSGNTLMPESNTDWSFLTVFTLLESSNYWNYPRCARSAPVNSFSANSLPEQSTYLDSPHKVINGTWFWYGFSRADLLHSYFTDMALLHQSSTQTTGCVMNDTHRL